MAYEAVVLPVMIASPGDVFEEREVIREVVNSWNGIHSLRTGVVLMPTGWETNASPELGSRPQALINGRILEKCDLLIGVFWTRLGSPTGEAESGTVEEIRKHVKAGKPAMVYFSRKPVVPQTFDQDQWSALQSFKEECKGLGLIWEFDDLVQFRELLSRQLQICMNENPYLLGLIPSSSREVVDLPLGLAKPGHDLSEQARVLLGAASRDSGGTILMVATLGGRFVQAGGVTYGAEGARESARWEHALTELVDRKFAIPRGTKGQVFELSSEGWDLAEAISADATGL